MGTPAAHLRGRRPHPFARHPRPRPGSRPSSTAPPPPSPPSPPTALEVATDDGAHRTLTDAADRRAAGGRQPERLAHLGPHRRRRAGRHLDAKSTSSPPRPWTGSPVTSPTAAAANPTHTWNTRPDATHPPQASRRRSQPHRGRRRRHAPATNPKPSPPPTTRSSSTASSAPNATTTPRSSPPARPTCTCRLERARKDAARAGRDHHDAAAPLAWAKRQRDQLGPLNPIRRGSRDRHHPDTTKTSPTPTTRLEEAARPHHRVDTKVADLEAAAGRTHRLGHQHAWRFARLHEIDRQPRPPLGRHHTPPPCTPMTPSPSAPPCCATPAPCTEPTSTNSTRTSPSTPAPPSNTSPATSATPNTPYAPRTRSSTRPGLACKEPSNATGAGARTRHRHRHPHPPPRPTPTHRSHRDPHRRPEPPQHQREAVQA